MYLPLKSKKHLLAIPITVMIYSASVPGHGNVYFDGTTIHTLTISANFSQLLKKNVISLYYYCQLVRKATCYKCTIVIRYIPAPAVQIPIIHWLGFITWAFSLYISFRFLALPT